MTEEYCDCPDCKDSMPCQGDCDRDSECQGCREAREEQEEQDFEADCAEGRR